MRRQSLVIALIFPPIPGTPSAFTILLLSFSLDPRVTPLPRAPGPGMFEN